MPATPADIAAGTREAVTVTWSDPAIAARYMTARDGSVSPATGYFDSAGDAQTIVNARGALIGAERRRFTAVAKHLGWPDLGSGFPTVTLIDANQRANGAFLAARIEIDLEAETTSYELFG